MVDEKCSDHIKNWITKKEKEGDIAREDSLTKGKRLSWKSLLGYIVRDLCKKTGGSFHYLKVHTVLRQDNQAFHGWCHTIQKIVQKVMRHKKGWEKIVDEEALTVLVDWLQTGEIRTLEMHLVKKNLHNKHKSIELMPYELTVEEFVEMFQDVDTNRLPNKFTQSKQKEALAKTLVSWAKYIAVFEENEKNKKEVARLNNLLKAGNGDTRSRKQPEQRQRKPNDKPPPNNKNMNDGVKIGSYGKARPGCCQHCQNIGLKHRRHASKDCDPKLRAERLQAKQAKDAAKSNKQRQNKPQPKPTPQPTFNLMDYGPNACRHCIREGADPKFANRHLSHSCFRRPEGELDKLGIKDPAARTKKIKQLIKELLEKKQAKHTNVSNATKVSFVSTKISTQTQSGPDAIYDERHGTETIDRNDPRLSKYSKYLGHRYLRNELAIKAPLTEEELDGLFACREDRINPKLRDRKRMKYEWLEGLHRLRDLRTNAPAGAPNPPGFYQPTLPGYTPDPSPYNAPTPAPHKRQPQAEAGAPKNKKARTGIRVTKSHTTLVSHATPAPIPAKTPTPVPEQAPATKRDKLGLTHQYVALTWKEFKELGKQNKQLGQLNGYKDILTHITGINPHDTDAITFAKSVAGRMFGELQEFLTRSWTKRVKDHLQLRYLLTKTEAALRSRQLELRYSESSVRPNDNFLSEQYTQWALKERRPVLKPYLRGYNMDGITAVFTDHVLNGTTSFPPMDRYTTVAQIDQVMRAYKADIMFTRMDHSCDVEDEKHIKIYIDKLQARRKELEKPYVHYLPRPETAQTLVSATETNATDVEPLYDGDEPTETMHLHRTLNPHVEGRAVRQCDRCNKHFYRNGFYKDGWNGIVGLALGDPIIRVCRRCSDATDHDAEHSDDTDGIQSVTSHVRGNTTN